jgi:hypothetical protein
VWGAFWLGTVVALALVALLVLIERFVGYTPRWSRWPTAIVLTIILFGVGFWFVSAKSLPIAVGGMTGCFIGAIAYRIRYGHWWDKDA